MKLELPLSVYVSRRKRWNLNLNQYRNAHFRVLSAAKREYTKIVQSQVADERGRYKGKKVHLTWTLWMPTRRKVDVSNVCSIIEKFACDALTDADVWLDDDYHTVTGSTYLWGGVDRDNPRCELFIEEI